MASIMPFAELFPRSGDYPPFEGGNDYPLLRESATDLSGYPFSERHLQCVWFDESLRPPALRSERGEEIEVIDPGRWNLEEGPDFLDAVLFVRTGNRRVRGDVEIHIRPRDWLAHGHVADGRYDRVIAHVTYFSAPLGPREMPSGIIQMAIKEALGANPEFSFENVDILAYPYSFDQISPAPCMLSMAKLSAEARRHALASAGEERLRRKTVRTAKRIAEAGPDQTLYEETMSALGYKKNSKAFRMLAGIVTHDHLRAISQGNAVKAYAVLLGVSGLMPDGIRGDWDSESKRFIRSIWDHWWKERERWENRIMPRSAWNMSGMRPQNRPIRRLAAGAALFGGREIFSNQLAETVETATGSCAVLAHFLQKNSNMSFWSARLGLSGKRRDRETALIGADRASAVVSNVIVPFLSATGRASCISPDTLPPEGDNAIVRRTACALLGRDCNDAFMRSGLIQQGLMQVFQDFCLNNANGCEECAFAAALAECAAISKGDPGP